MAHFAKLDENNIVIDINAVANAVLDDLPFPESEPIGIAFLTEWSGGYQNWRQTSYNRNFRKNYAGFGFRYDEDLDAFVPPKPFPSWVLDLNTVNWIAPIPYPIDGNIHTWDENTLSWVLVSE